MGEVMKEANFSLASVKFTTAANINSLVLQNVTKAQRKVKTDKENVAGWNIKNHFTFQVCSCRYSKSLWRDLTVSLNFVRNCVNLRTDKLHLAIAKFMVLIPLYINVLQY